ncbi:MAG: C45 family peptidase [Capnocytophaga sp.]|nr:C45 family peptidase [Capnocytophaga sp.]
MIDFLRNIFLYIAFLLLGACSAFQTNFKTPNIDSYPFEIPKVIQINDTLRVFKNNYLLKNKQNLWELHSQGNPYQLGLTSGALLENLYKQQDSIFYQKINSFVPSARKQKFLFYFLKWFNRDIEKNIIPEYRAELYGISHYSDSIYNIYSPAYQRVMYLHGAHDIGHALQDLMLVACSSLVVWGDKTPDGKLLIGRNLDFYVGDDFAQNKVISFIKPSSGIPFMSVGWAGMIGVVSGMNKEGLSVTINASKSDIPLKAKTPISLLCREILQYASTIDEAIAIAKKRAVFVSENILIGSAKDKKAVIIEISPKKIDVFEPQNSDNLICTNHFQSATYQNDKNNVKQINETHSFYRYQKLEELLNYSKKITPESMAEILRNTEGLENKSIGYGNEKAINQLLAHHGIIFKPEEKLVWVSANPYQLGEFVCYDLERIFSTDFQSFSIAETSQKNISKSTFLSSQEYKNYEKYRVLERKMELALKTSQIIEKEEVVRLKELNPDYWKAYFIIGKILYQQKNKEATENFEKSLSLEIPYLEERKEVEKYLKKSKKLK